MNGLFSLRGRIIAIALAILLAVSYGFYYNYRYDISKLVTNLSINYEAINELEDQYRNALGVADETQGLTEYLDGFHLLANPVIDPDELKSIDSKVLDWALKGSDLDDATLETINQTNLPQIVTTNNHHFTLLESLLSDMARLEDTEELAINSEETVEVIDRILSSLSNYSESGDSAEIDFSKLSKLITAVKSEFEALASGASNEEKLTYQYNNFVGEAIKDIRSIAISYLGSAIEQLSNLNSQYQKALDTLEN